MKFTLEQIAHALGVAAPPALAETVAEGWSIDSRTLKPGEVFFALRGPNHDGHAHLPEVWSKGAIAAVVEVACAGPVLQVGGTLAALQQLAAWARDRWAGEIVAVTGSAGKTTTKDVIAEMLSVKMKTAKSEGNLNNHIGLPLSLLRLNPEARVAVMEMGMNHAGEIRRLAQIARPSVGVVTNVGFAHAENFASIEEVAAAKRELIESLSPEGTAVLNRDDPRVAQFAKVHTGRTILYGQSQSADVRAEDVTLSPEGARFRVNAVEFSTSLPGSHNVSNILAGIAVAGIYGILPQQLIEPVASLHPGKMRGERLVHNGVTIYNDCYNSNPAAVRAMLDVLRDTPARKRIAVLGEMGELGASAPDLHREVGAYAAECGIDVLIGIQGHAADIVAGFGIANAKFLADPKEAGCYAAKIAQPGDAILFKGSRAVRVELALERFMSPTGLQGGQ